MTVANECLYNPSLERILDSLVNLYKALIMSLGIKVLHKVRVCIETRNHYQKANRKFSKKKLELSNVNNAWIQEDVPRAGLTRH